MGLLAFGEETSLGERSFQGSLDSWLHIWNRQVANLQSPEQLRGTDVGELGLIWLYNQRAEDQADLNPFITVTLQGELSAFWTPFCATDEHNLQDVLNSRIVTNLLVPLVIF